ncbi:MAG: hypothetical protein RI973_1199, partial [Bacteroidota bacterium]
MKFIPLVPIDPRKGHSAGLQPAECPKIILG